MDKEPSQLEIEEMPGTLLLEFGAHWCGHCQAAQALIASALEQHPNIRHIRIEDGKGRKLGRMYRVKLWPTLIFMQDGVEIRRVVRPTHLKQVLDIIA